ncbi:unnamed protein product, partial [Amoebophrya sp. A25]|eukprot:GSA25T00009812001.1
MDGGRGQRAVDGGELGSPNSPPPTTYTARHELPTPFVALHDYVAPRSVNTNINESSLFP